MTDVKARCLSELSIEELNNEIQFVNSCNPSSQSQMNSLIDYASKLKIELIEENGLNE